MIRRIAFALSVCVCATPLAAVAQSMGGVSYSWSLPTGDLENFIDNDSWVGFALEGRKFVKPGMSVGLYFGWNEFYENTDEPIILGTTIITGDQYRDLNSFQMMGNAHVYTGKYGSGRLFVGINAGAYYMRQLVDVGVFTFETDNWHFGVAPEIGYMFPGGGRHTNFMIRAMLHYPFASGDYLGGQSRTFQYLSIGIGVLQGRGRGSF